VTGMARRGVAGRLAAVAVAAALLAAGWAHADGAVGGARMPGMRAGWHRVLADDFAGSRLNRRVWTPYTGEPGGDPGGWWEPSHAVVGGGVLNLETYPDPRAGGRWVSAGVSSARALEQRYGMYLVRFRMDAGKGVAGILLLWPQAPHWPPEIDFAETGGERASRDDITATLHYAPGDQTVARSVRADFTRWHVVGVEWAPRRLVYTLDGRPWAVVKSAHVPAEPMELDLQTQTGTCGSAFAPCPDATTPARVDMQVDWVVAYARR
jgi:beta-glucanase (GH16 family)